MALVACDACEPEPPATPASDSPRDREAAARVRDLVAAGELRCLVGESGWVRCDGPGGDALSRALEGVTHLALHEARGCAVHGDGSVSCWTAGGVPAEVDGISAARGVAVGADHACALHRDGRVSCWGNNRRGQLGDGTTEDRDEPVPVEGLSGVSQMVAGEAHSCALLSDGSVRCWGGHAGIGDMVREPRTAEEIAELVPEPVRAPTPVPGVEGAARIAAASSESCAVTEDRRVMCWRGYLGGQAATRALAWPDDAVQVAVGEWGKCAVREGGAAVCWDFASPDGRGRLVAPVAVRGVEDAVEIAVGRSAACALDGGGRVVCWSDAQSAQTDLGLRGDPR